MKIKIPSSLRLRNLFYNRKFNITISLIISFVIWLVIMINENPIRDQSFTDIKANISIENTVASELGLGIVSDVASQNFTVTVSGPNYIVSTLKAEDIMLSADVTDINAAGTYTLEILGSRNSSKSGYTFTSINPSSIDVTFDYIDTKEFTVIPKLIGVSAAEGLVAETPIISNSDQSTISIKGPRSLINKIAGVSTYAEVNKTLNSTQSFDSDIVLYDSNEEIIYRYASDGRVLNKSGEEVNAPNLSMSFTSLKVTQPISKKISVPVKPNFSNLPSGISIDDLSVSVDYKTVTIIGTPDVVGKISELSLSAIDFRNVSSTSNSFEVSATLPEGAKILETIDFFTVTVDTSGFSEKPFDILNIKWTGLNPELSAKTDSRIKNVKICGPANVINSLKASDFYAVVDLTDKSAGVHTVDAVIKSEKFSNVWQVGTYSTAVTIR